MSLALCVTVVMFSSIDSLMHHHIRLLHYVSTGPLIQNGSTALWVASAAGQTDVVNLLITRGATVEYNGSVSACEKS